MTIIARADLSIYQKINVCVRNLENKNPAGAIVVFIISIRSDILIRIFEGELGREKHIADIDNFDVDYLPNKGELIAFDDDEDEDVWEVINVLYDYPNHEISVFVKRYIWPDER